VKGDISGQIAAAKQDLIENGVHRADDADKFAQHSDTEWLQELDKRYALAAHTHEGPAAYRRYIKHFSTDPGLDAVLLLHGLGVFPLVDVYELVPVTNGANNTGDCKLFFYYGHADEETYGLSVRVGRERARLGLPFGGVLAELGVRYSDDSSIGDVVNDMQDALRKDPNDEIKTCTSPWLDECCGEARSVAELKRTQQWDDLYLAIKPRKCARLCGSGVPPDSTPFEVGITHVDYHTLWLNVVGLGTGGRTDVDLMVLLRS
jgi:hypothetical protein